MGVLLGMLYAVLGIALVAMARSLTTLIHELGHAVPSLIYTEGPVEVFVGNYGKKEKTIPLDFGRLKIFLELNMLTWYSGLCKHAKIENTKQRLITILMGPLASLIFGLLCLWFIISFDFNNAIKTLIGIYILSSVLDFFVNIIPRKNPILLEDGSFCYNDGQSIISTLAYDNLPSDFKKGYTLIEEEKFEEAKQILESLRENQPELTLSINHALLIIYQKEQNYKEAIDLYHEIDNIEPLDLLDYKELGLLFQKTGRHDKAIVCFSKYLYMNFSDAAILNARAYSYIKEDRLEEGSEDITSAFNANKELALNYITRALYYKKLDKLDLLKENLLSCLSLDEKNHEAHLELARYYESANDSALAVQHYKLAQQHGSLYHGIEYKLETLKERDF